MMRIDKFLKVSRLIKRREIAKQLCDASKVLINGKIAKASSEINEGDELEIILGSRHIVGKVNKILPYANKQTCQDMFAISEEGER